MASLLAGWDKFKVEWCADGSRGMVFCDLHEHPQLVLLVLVGVALRSRRGRQRCYIILARQLCVSAHYAQWRGSLSVVMRMTSDAHDQRGEHSENYFLL